ncbi:hypothetical protein BDP67DRAFT_489235 [Colletotrichum lupini]|nr:hypothetical protein BDP67DRAFT_489235 [Colletotrichum lupini]
MGEILVDRRKVGINVAGSTRISRSDVPHMMFNGIGYILSRKFAAPIFYLWARHVSGGGSPNASAPAFTGSLPVEDVRRCEYTTVTIADSAGIVGERRSAEYDIRFRVRLAGVRKTRMPFKLRDSLGRRWLLAVAFKPLRLLSFTEWISPGAGGPETGGSDSGRRTHSSNVPQGRKAKTPPTLVGALIAGCARD